MYCKVSIVQGQREPKKRRRLCTQSHRLIRVGSFCANITERLQMRPAHAQVSKELMTDVLEIKPKRRVQQFERVYSGSLLFRRLQKQCSDVFVQIVRHSEIAPHSDKTKPTRGKTHGMEQESEFRRSKTEGWKSVSLIAERTSDVFVVDGDSR